MWAIIKAWLFEIVKNPLFIRLALTAGVAWFVTAGGCSLTARVSTAWAKRQAYKQGYRAGKDTCEADETKGEKRRWRLFSEAPEPVPFGGWWYGVTDTYCIDGEPIDVEPTPAIR